MSVPWGRDSFMSVSNKPSGLFRRNTDRVSSSLGQRKGLWSHLFIERAASITLSLESYCLCNFSWKSTSEEDLWALCILRLFQVWVWPDKCIKRENHRMYATSHTNIASEIVTSTRLSLPLHQSLQVCEIWQHGDQESDWFLSMQNWCCRDISTHWW